MLSDLGQNQLGLDIYKERNRDGSYFMGLKIRGENDYEPPLITGNTEVLKNTATHIVINANPQLENTNVINKVWTMVMDYVMDVLKDVVPLWYTASHNGKNKKRTAHGSETSVTLAIPAKGIFSNSSLSIKSLVD